MINIGVFDSGIGGQAIAKVLRIDFPDHKIIVVNDKKNVPYGDKNDEEIINLTNAAIQPLLKKSCKVIVIACNTATAIAIKFLRKKYPDQHFIGIEPMIKTAEKLSKNRIITVCATPATLRSKNYNRLKNTFGKDLIFFEPDCSNWTRMIEDSNINHSEIKKNNIKIRINKIRCNSFRMYPLSLDKRRYYKKRQS